MQALILVIQYPTDTLPLNSSQVLYGLQGSIGQQWVRRFPTQMIRIE